MIFSRAHFMAACQQLLVTAFVGAVVFSAAGVMTLQVVQPGQEEPAFAETSSPRALTGMAGVADLVATTLAMEADPEGTPEGLVATEKATPIVDEVDIAADEDGSDGIDAPESAPEAQPSAEASPANPEVVSDRADGLLLAAQSAPQPVHGFATAGVVWDAPSPVTDTQIAFELRTKKAGQWSQWEPVAYHDEHAEEEDAGAASSHAQAEAGRPGTEAVLLGEVNRVQLRVFSHDGALPAGLRLLIIDPGATQVRRELPAIDTSEEVLAAPARSGPATPTAAAPASGTAASLPADANQAGLVLASMKPTPKPLIFTRSQWGADERLRTKKSLRYGKVRAGFVHHTAGSNNYLPSDVPAVMRGIYAFHTQGRDWSDIGYNFLVDRFGQIWEGRFGGTDRAVVGAHTLGYNEVAFAASAIGNFDQVKAPKAMIQSLAALFSWKLSLHNVKAKGKVNLKGTRLARISGHRDAGKTACPGANLYPRIKNIRRQAHRIQNGQQKPVELDTLEPLPKPVSSAKPAADPLPAKAQPSSAPIAPKRLTGSSWPELITVTAGGLIQIQPTAGMLGYRPARLRGKGKAWRKMNLVAAVGKVTRPGAGAVMARKPNGVVRVFRVKKNGTIVRPAVARSRDFASSNLIIGAGDVNRDGRLDVISRDRATKALLLHRGNGDGTFAPPTRIRKKWHQFRSTSAAPKLLKGKRVRLLALNRNAKGGLWVFTLTPKGKIKNKRRIATLGSKARDVFGVGDVTGNGKGDVAVRWADGTLTIYEGTGRPKLGNEFGPFDAAQGLTGLSVGNLHRAKGLELLGRDSLGRVVTIAHNGRKNLAPRLPTKLVLPGVTQVLSVGDWTGNGHGDLMTREDNGKVLVLREGMGNGRFGQGISLGKGWRPFKQLIAVGDITGDGKPDLIGREGPGSPLIIFPGAGKDGIGEPRLAPASLRLPNQIGAGAWPQDGPVLSNGARFTNFVPLGATGTTLRKEAQALAATYDAFIAAGDVNGDGVADVLAREARTGTLWLLPGKTSGGFGSRMWVADGFAGFPLLG